MDYKTKKYKIQQSRDMRVRKIKTTSFLINFKTNSKQKLVINTGRKSKRKITLPHFKYLDKSSEE